ncbi:MAG: radical SAM protein, partial [Mailhella sp.]|nr:radical SAM protein [Mailhella sp.]
DKYGDGTSFPELLRQVAAIPGLRRIRFVSAHPRDFSQETIDMFAELPQLMPRLHLPLQSGSDSMLKKMGRGYNMERFLGVVEGLRKARPDFALSTDLIVGFPSETEEEFEDTLKAIDSCGFMSSFSFCYSDRPGTRASAMPCKIPHEVQLARLERLQTLQNERAEAWLRTRVGLETDVLLESPSHKQEGQNLWQGRDPWGDPVNVLMPEGDGRPGQFVDVKIEVAKKHSLMAVPVQK